MGTGSVNLTTLLASLDRLPALPATAARAVSLLSKNSSSAAEIERIFRVDEGLAAATLRRANSVTYAAGASRSFGLKESITRLGNRTLMRLALEHQAASTLRDAGKCYGLERGALWRSSIGGAAVAERIAQESRTVDPDLCFSAALLRDIGKLALDALAQGERAMNWGRSVDRPFVDIERERFGADHAEIGALLAEKWSMPAEIVLAVRHHHAPPESPINAVCDIVHCADCVTRWAGLGIGDDGMCHPLSPRARDAVDLHRERVEALAAYGLEFVTTLDRELHGNRTGEPRTTGEGDDVAGALDTGTGTMGNRRKSA
ncbi:MAG: HDOD domain-containing protein [Phycisphaerae bacterium]|nr:HDOD domain-containing protein [Phycisphaerae bacterium]